MNNLFKRSLYGILVGITAIVFTSCGDTTNTKDSGITNNAINIYYEGNISKIKFGTDSSFEINGVFKSANSSNNTYDTYDLNLTKSEKLYCYLSIDNQYKTTSNSVSLYISTGSSNSSYYQNKDVTVKGKYIKALTLADTNLTNTIHTRWQNNMYADYNYTIHCAISDKYTSDINIGIVKENENANSVYQVAQEFQLDSDSNATITGSLNYQYDQRDHYKFTTNTNINYVMSLSDSSGSTGNIKIDVLKEDGTNQYINASGNSINPSLDVNTTYIIKVYTDTNPNSFDGNYTITITGNNNTHPAG